MPPSQADISVSPALRTSRTDHDDVKPPLHHDHHIVEANHHSDPHHHHHHHHHHDHNSHPYSATSASPDDGRKRRHRSRSSPEVNSARWSGGYASASTSHHRPLYSDEAISPTIPSPRQPLLGRPRLSPTATSSETTGSSRTETNGLNGGEDRLTVRRREANRLAAQRFRSRKKGYQDSLEEKVRQLEEDKDHLVRRLTESAGVILPSSQKGTRKSSREESDRRSTAARDTSPILRRTNSLALGASPERSVEPDIRIAALESANRKLQDELKTVADENDKLRDELDHWRRWDREQREASWARENATRDPRTQAYPSHPTADPGPITRTPLPSISPTTYSPRGPPTIPPSHSLSHIRQPAVEPTPYAAPGQNFRLPPIRLPPLTRAISMDRSSAITAEMPHFLPRPAELDALGAMPLSGRPSQSPSEERRRWPESSA